MLPSAKCVSLVANFEGERLVSYLCPARVLTIGCGHTGPDVKPGMKITREQSRALLLADLSKFGQGVSDLLTGYETLQSEFDAMVSLAYNIGLSAFRTSSALRQHRQGYHAEAGDSFLMWDKFRTDGELVVSVGLHNRRLVERALYLSGV